MSGVASTFTLFLSIHPCKYIYIIHQAHALTAAGVVRQDRGRRGHEQRGGIAQAVVIAQSPLLLLGDWGVTGGVDEAIHLFFGV